MVFGSSYHWNKLPTLSWLSTNLFSDSSRGIEVLRKKFRNIYKMLNYPHTFHINPTSILVCMKMKVAQLCPTLCDPMAYTVHGILQARILEWVAFPFSRGSNPGLLHCRWILYQLSHQGSPRILEWVAYPFSRGSSQPRNQTKVSCIAGGLFTNWAMRETH